MKKTRIILFTAIAALIAFAAVSPAHAMDILKPVGISFDAGKIIQDEGQNDLYFVSAIPQFKFGHLSAAVSVNYIVDREFNMRDAGRDFIVLDELRYYKGDKFKLHYGELENITFGSGFIVSNYRTNIRGNTPLNRQGGLEIDLKSDDSYIKAFGSRTTVFGIRGVRNISKFRLGATAVSDDDPEFSEVGVDLETNFKTELIKFYAESAKIINYGNGFAVGAISNVGKYVSAKAELRDYSPDFLPGMVDEHYDAGSPFNRLVNTKRTDGLYTSVDFFPGNENTIGIAYESYENYKPRTTLKVKGQLGSRLRGDLFYAGENFIPRSGLLRPKNPVIRGILTFNLNRHFDIIFDYYRAYDDNLNKLESMTVKTRFKFK